MRGLDSKHFHHRERKLALRKKVLDKRQRNKSKIFARLGFASYDEYLESDFWKAIRERVFAEKGKKCVKCGKPANTVHHSRYDRATLMGETIESLFPVCRKCHIEAEDAPRRFHESKSKLRRANERLGVDS